MSRLTDEQKAELEGLGPEIVLTKLMQPGAGPGAALKGFKSAPLGLARSDVENWLAEKQAQQAKDRQSTLDWARIAGWAAIGSVIATVLVGVITVAVTIWLAKP